MQASLNRPSQLPRVDDDGDEEMEIDEEGVDDQVVVSCNRNMLNNCKIEETDKEVNTDNQDMAEPAEDKINLSCSGSQLQNEESSSTMLRGSFSSPVDESNNVVTTGISGSDAPHDAPCELMKSVSPDSLSIGQSDLSPILKSPTPSVSPRISSSRKSLKTSSMLSASEKDLHVESDLDTKTIHRKSSSTAFPGHTAPNPLTRTEHLAASIRHGLEIIENHHNSVALRRSPFRFSLRPTESKPLFPVDKVDVGVQASLEGNVREEDPFTFTCNNCKSKMQLDDVHELDNSSNLQLVPVDCPESTEKPKRQLLKVCSRLLALFPIHLKLFIFIH